MPLSQMNRTMLERQRVPATEDDRQPELDLLGPASQRTLLARIPLVLDRLHSSNQPPSPEPHFLRTTGSNSLKTFHGLRTTKGLGVNNVLRALRSRQGRQLLKHEPHHNRRASRQKQKKRPKPHRIIQLMRQMGPSQPKRPPTAQKRWT